MWTLKQIIFDLEGILQRLDKLKTKLKKREQKMSVKRRKLETKESDCRVACARAEKLEEKIVEIVS